YGVAFETKEELKKYLWQQEESLKRDHRILGEKLKLFTFAEKVGPGLPLWLPKGTIIREEIENRAKKVEKDWGYERVATPHIAKEELYKMSGHIPYYAESMFPPMKLDDGNYYLKAMNCPHTHMIYKSEPRSYRDLPIRYAEYGTVYRYELSGTLAGLLRTRGFTQNDAHIYCREDQVEEEFLKVMKLHEFWYKNVFSITDFYMRLSLPTKNKDKFANIPEGWEKSVEILRSTMKKSGLPFIEAEGEAAFYGPKVDFQIKSVIGREETASTNQLDFLATKRFNLTYTDNDGKEKPVYVIHRAPLGSHERFIAFLIEHYAGEFPFWLAPVQTTVLTVTDRANSYAEEIVKTLKNKEIRVSYDQRNETIGKKIREAELQKIPYIIIIGDREMESKTISVRQHKKGDLGKMALEDFLKLADK
ncbi:MAG: threonine--tRNA ligase, partial [Candidatus Sungbacteria bacterium RIFCSPHIGHO2_02_FULL_41_12b]